MKAVVWRRGFRSLSGLLVLALCAFGAWKIRQAVEREVRPDRFPLYVLFKNVQGLRPGSRVLHRGMVVGEAAVLELDPGGRRVRVRLDLLPEAAPLVTTRTECWVVRPRFGGLAGGLRGLDTLIKESYLRLRAPPGGEVLPAGSEILGYERPPEGLSREELEDPLPGDLLGTVALPETHGIHAGSPVLHRGVKTGEVRSVRLSPDGEAVFVRFRVERRFRKTVDSRTKFWVHRPVLRGSLLAGIRVDHLGSILAPALAYGRGNRRAGSPAEDEAVFEGLSDPPEGVEKMRFRGRVPPEENERRTRAVGTGVLDLEPLASVRYEAVERDFWSADDQVLFDGEGVLFEKEGRILVLCPRSLCDASFALRGNFFDRLKIEGEKIRVRLSDGRVFSARRVWTAPSGGDLALLELNLGASPFAGRLPDPSAYLTFSRGPERPEPVDYEGEKKEGGVVRLLPSGPIRHDGKIAGFFGQEKGYPRRRRRLGLRVLPERWRPGRGAAPKASGGGGRERGRGR